MRKTYEKYENVIFSGFSTLNFVLSTMAGLALRENDIGYARFLSGKVQAVAHTLEMGKYNEYSPMLDIVCAGKDVEGTYKVVKLLIDNVGTMYDFRKSGLYKHMKFRDIDEAILDGLKEKITKGDRIDSIINMEPSDFLIMKNQQEMLTSPELSDYIEKQKRRGFANIKEFEIEYHKRIAMSFASFILTIIGVSLSSRKTKGGMGLHLGIGLGLSFSYILFQTITSTFAVNGNVPPAIAVWIPNILYAGIAFFLYQKAPK